MKNVTKVYFTASTGSINKLRESYIKILTAIGKNRCKNLNDYIGKVLEGKEIDIDRGPKTDNHIYTESLKHIKESLFLIADVTYPSITVGRQIEYALQHNIPVICLQNIKKTSYISPSLYDTEIEAQTFRSYSDSTISLIIKDYIQNFKSSKIRFNLFISKEQETFLNWLSDKKKTFKSNIIRDLIEEEMGRDQDYKS